MRLEEGGVETNSLGITHWSDFAAILGGTCRYICHGNSQCAYMCKHSIARQTRQRNKTSVSVWLFAQSPLRAKTHVFCRRVGFATGELDSLALPFSGRVWTSDSSAPNSSPRPPPKSTEMQESINRG